MLIVFWGNSTGIEAVLFTTKARKFCSCDIACAAERVGISGVVCRRERLRTFRREFRYCQNVGCGVQVAKGVSADEAKISREGD